MMTKYAVLLRGVNVGGVNLKMAEVATALTDAGFAAVRTILASGNVLLESSAKAAAVRKKAEAALRALNRHSSGGSFLFSASRWSDAERSAQARSASKAT